MKGKYDAIQTQLNDIIEQWKHLYLANESNARFQGKAELYAEEACKFVEKFYFQLSLQRTSKQLVENLKLRDKPRGMNTDETFLPDEPTIREIVRQEIKVAVKTPHQDKKMSPPNSNRGRSITIKPPVKKGNPSVGRSKSRSKSRNRDQASLKATSKSPVPQNQKPQNFRDRPLNKKRKKWRQKKPGGQG